MRKSSSPNREMDNRQVFKKFIPAIYYYAEFPVMKWIVSLEEKEYDNGSTLVSQDTILENVPYLHVDNDESTQEKKKIRAFVYESV